MLAGLAPCLAGIVLVEVFGWLKDWWVWVGVGLTLALFVLAAVLAGIYVWVRQTIPAPPDLTSGDGLSPLRDYARQIVQSAPARWLLAPFRAMVAPAKNCANLFSSCVIN